MTRGRPRKTDIDTVLDSAMKLFWKNGFEATSMNDITAETGMAKPGLYNCFGNKEALYAKALDRYINVFGVSVAELAASAGPLEPALREFLLAVARSVTDAGTPCGCFLTNTLVETSDKPSEIAALGRQLNERRNRALSERFHRAAAAGELGQDADPDALAAFFSAQALALGALASSGSDFPELCRYIDTAMTVLPPAPMAPA